MLYVCLYFNIFIENYQAAVVNNVGGLTLNIRLMTGVANLSSFRAYSRDGHETAGSRTFVNRIIYGCN